MVIHIRLRLPATAPRDDNKSGQHNYGAGIVDTPMSALLAMTLMPHVLLLAALPLSINGWGVREVAIAALLNLAGVPVEQAVAISVLFGIAILIARMPLGFVWFWRPTPS